MCTQQSVHNSTHQSAHNCQYLTVSTQHSVHNCQYIAVSTRLSVYNSQYTTVSTRLSVHNSQYTIVSTQQSVHDSVKETRNPPCTASVTRSENTATAINCFHLEVFESVVYNPDVTRTVFQTSHIVQSLAVLNPNFSRQTSVHNVKTLPKLPR